MKTKTFILALGIAATLCTPWQGAFAQEKERSPTSEKGSTDAIFIKKAAHGGMMEVELGRIAAEKGQSQDVKDFGNRMVKDHSKANDQLKEVAGKMSAKMPRKLNARHKGMVDQLSAMSGAEFDKAYVKAMIKDHEQDIAELEKADKEVKSADLKKFIEDTIPIMKEHLEMIKKFDQAKS